VAKYRNLQNIKEDMSFLRPHKECIYVISDINGMHNELELILSRILPLRKTGGQIDKLIFLGNYKSNKVLDLIIKAKSNQPDQIHCLLGSNEYLFNNSLKQNSDIKDYKLWMANGGEDILIGYLFRIQSENKNPYLINRQYIKRFIPKEHIDFLYSLLPYYIIDNYIFVHGGCDPNIELSNQNINVLVNDRSVFNLVCNAGNKFKCPWNKTIVTGGVGKLDGNPLIRDKFITLDGSYAERLYVMELNSGTIFSARKGKNRLVKESIT